LLPSRKVQEKYGKRNRAEAGDNRVEILDELFRETEMNNELPIAAFKGEILQAVKENPVVIITAETGAGKSTQVPQFLLEEGNDIVVTQPRRLAARTVAERVAYEYGCELGETVGFRTAYERADSHATRCLFVTDGLALVRELMGAGHHQVLVLDEVHEWNLNLEVLVAWVRKRLAEGANFKVVLMSATLEAEKLSNFFGGAPIISVPGRLFPVTEEKPQGRELVMDVERLLRAGRNVLVFQPGKREISETVTALESLRKLSGLNAEILSLHGELETADQRKCFVHYARPKVVVSTNVAETSVTIDDIDAVVDSGMERRIEVMDGVEGLYLKPISMANSSQRKGRAGRCKPGVYIDWCASIDRLEFPKAEILRSRLDQTVLRLAEAGFDMEELEFFHQPAKSEIHDAKRALHALGCLGEKGEVTKIGHHVAKLPVSVQFGRMLVEADRLGVVDDVLTVAAILEQGDITMRPRDKYEEPAWRKLCRGEETSDILAQLSVWKQAERMNKTQMFDNGIFAKAYFQAKEKRQHLEEALHGKVREFRSSGKQEDILRAVCAGMVDHLYQRQYGSWKNGDGQERELAKESVVRGGDWLVGMPFDLQIKTRRGGMMTLRLVRMATKVDPSWLVEIAPQLVKLEQGLEPKYEELQDVCTSLCRTHFNGQKVAEVREATPNHPEAARVFAEWVAGQME
jgi:ATP-dependent helicase HrpA